MSWLHKVLGKDSVTQLAVDSTHFAARMSERPMHLGTRGSYSLSAPSGTMAAGLGANAEIFQFRWTDTTRKMLLRSVKCAGGGIAAFTAGFGKFEVVVARSWTADGTSGTAISFGTNDQKRRTDFATTLAPSGLGVRISSTAALGAGTKTLDANAFAGHAFGLSATAGATLGNPGISIWERDTGDEYPLLFEQNEGFIIRATVPATGTWTFVVQVEWAEIDATEVDGWA